MDKGKIIHLYDDTGWTCNVPCTFEQWTIYKQTARKEHMKIADWLEMAIIKGCESLIAKHEAEDKNAN